jgi:tetratricopeptide (TPR) repeat protein
LLQSAIAHTSDPDAALNLQGRLLSTLAGTHDPVLISRELSRMRHLARDHPGRLGLYYSYAQLHARELGVEKPVADELHAAWAEGRGLLQAGLVLVSWQLDRKDGNAEKTLAQLLERSDLTEIWLRTLVSPLLAAGRPDLAARIQQRLLEVNPLDDARLFDLIDSLDHAGRRDEAMAALAKWGARARISEDFASKVAAAWLRFGQPELAESFLRDIANPGAIVRDYRPFLTNARLQLSLGRLREAKTSLRKAFQYPGARAFDELVAWLDASRKLDGADADLALFSLTPLQMGDARRAIFEYLEKKGLADDALKLLESHPELLDHKMPARIRRLAAGGGKFEQGAALLDSAVAQGTAAPEAADELALLFSAWAEEDLSSGHTLEGQAHLDRAQELRPALFDVAKKLWKLHRQRGEPDQAKAAVERFLAAAQDPKERDQAQRLLTQ